MSSRLIVKNLPKNITEAKLRQIFEEKGSITDIQLKYTKDGTFRQFAFVGYENETDANAALKFFNNIFIQTLRIKVEPCVALGSEKKPKSWSKHAVDSNAYRKIHGIDELEYAEKKKKQLEIKLKKKSKIDEIVGEHKDDPEFQEFMKVHEKNRNLWQNDDDIIRENNSEIVNQFTKSTESDHKAAESENICSNAEENDEHFQQCSTDSQDEADLSSTSESKKTESEKRKKSKLALQNEVSDLEYMKSLMKKGNKKPEFEKKPALEGTKTSMDLFTIKVRNVPLGTKKKDIINFFQPLKPYSVRIPINARGFCYVGFKEEKDFKRAMLKDKSFIKGKQVYFVNFTEKNKITKLKKQEESNFIITDKTGKWAKQERNLENEEDICESGKIFFRNLSYTICEDDIQNLFSKFGPIAEISLPIDPITRKIKGFGTVTFVMPEHAVQAYNELDGSTFHGRLLHLIPGKANDTMGDEYLEGLSFKEKKALKLRKSANQTHNWNILFMGTNAVADILANKFETTKETILDANTGGSSAAVRLALGETQIVLEMKKFLEDNGVHLGAFEVMNTKRSKTVILAKNLPAGTTVEELNPLFSKFGLLGRIVLPPSGVTAIIEFLDPSEAKKAFYKLAYSKFKHLPLYLEWAPENTFKNLLDSDDKIDEEVESKNKFLETEAVNQQKESDQSCIRKTKNSDECSEINNDDEDNDEIPEAGTTLFLKNLKFGTREDAVKNHFKHLGPIHLAQVAMRKDPKNPKNITSLGYGFIQFKKKSTAELALKQMQFTNIEGNSVELKRSDRTLKMDPKSERKTIQQSFQTGSKLLIRNIPFQTKVKEIYEIFKAFGELRSVRLPKKTSPGEQSLRGFGFVDYLSKSDAKKAFETLSGSTHLYGRRLVIEWAKNDENDVTELRKRTAESFKDVDKKLKKSNKSVFDATDIDENLKENEDDEMI